MTTIAMHVLLGILIGAVIITIIMATILISLIRSYTTKLNKMDELIRSIYSDEERAS
jgi:L-lactate permease